MNAKWRYLGIVSAILVLGTLVVLSVFIFETNERGEYDFVHPEKTYELPAELREISGMTVLSKKMLGCVEDEHGTVYFYQMREGKGFVKRRMILAPVGDFEGIAKVEKEVYLLRSDGTLFARSTKLKEQAVKRYQLDLPSENYEGLFYDKPNRRLLIVSREPDQDERGIPVYAFNVDKKRLEKEPAFLLQLNEADRDQYVFAPSDLAIHPVTGRLFVLSAADHALFVFNSKGKPVYTQRLNPTVFNKSEGIAFAKNGDLFISNEGQTEKPTILKFVYLH